MGFQTALRTTLIFLSLLGIFLQKLPASDTKSIEIAEDPDWVDIIPLEQLKTDDKQELILLKDTQVHVAKEAEYQRKVIRLTSAQAVQRFSQLSFSYDPSYQKLIINHFRIYRNGSFADIPVTPEQFRVVQVEKDLERYLYNGSVSALWFLEDIRVGDILDYAVTKQGRNPVFDGHFMSHISLEPEVRSTLSRYKVLSPKDLKLTVQTFHSKIETKSFETGNLKVYEWKIEHGKPRQVRHREDSEDEDADTDPADTVKSAPKEEEEPYRYPWIQITDFPNWEAVRDWSKKYFTVAPSQAPEIIALADQIKSEHPETADQIRAAIQFVQQEIRYLGIEMGSSSHQPAKPEEVLRRRFGDCKDKSMLLSTLLQTLGVQAGPAFVDSDASPEDDVLNPTVFAFNHCVVQFIYKGDFYWIDATMETQRGPIDTLYFPNFKRALVPSFSTNPYTYVVPKNKGVPYTEVTEVFNSPDYQKPASLDVEIRFENLAADQLRAYFLEHEQKELQKVYLKLYQGIYPKIEQQGDMAFSDDLEKNVLKVTAKYNIPEFWRWHEGYRCYYSVFYAQNIALNLRRGLSPTGRTRCHVKEIIDINVPPGGRLPPVTGKVKNNLLEYTLEGKRGDNRMTLQYEFQNLAEFLSEKDEEDMYSDILSIRNSLEYNLIVGTSPRQGGSERQAAPEKKERKFY